MFSLQLLTNLYQAMLLPLKAYPTLLKALYFIELSTLFTSYSHRTISGTMHFHFWLLCLLIKLGYLLIDDSYLPFNYYGSMFDEL